MCNDQEILQSYQDNNDQFFLLWLTHIDTFVANLKQVFDANISKRKENYQQPLRIVTNSEYIIFHMIIIGAYVYSRQGNNSQLEQKERKRERHRQKLFMLLCILVSVQSHGASKTQRKLCCW